MGVWSTLRRFAARSRPNRGQASKRSPARLRPLRPRDLRMEQFEDRVLLSIATWNPEGPAPIINGQVENVGPQAPTTNAYLNQVDGAVEAVATSTNPNLANVLYVGTVNGGVWKTTDVSSASPTWTPLTDSQSSLSISSISFDPSDGSGNTLVAGVGRVSSDTNRGFANLSGNGNLTGILRTTDGGTTWTSLSGNGALNGLSICAVAERGSIILAAVNDDVSGSYAGCGIYRSTNDGTTFTQISYQNGLRNGLPEGAAYDLVGDPNNANVFYTAVIGADQFGGQNGVYRSTDAGATWTEIGGSQTFLDANKNSLLNTAGNNATHNIRMSVGNSGQLFVGIVNNDPNQPGYDQVSAVYISANPQAKTVNWTKMDVPQTLESNGTNPVLLQQTAIPGDPLAQGSVYFSIAADLNDPTVVYIGCDYQPVIGAASSVGATNYSGQLFRGDASLPAGTQWASLTDSNAQPAGTTGGTASGSSPHAGSRGMAIDSSGRLIEVDDGGVYVDPTPQNNTGDWSSLIGQTVSTATPPQTGLQVSELNTIAYDDVSNVILAGSQNNDAIEQTAAGSSTWQTVNQTPSPTILGVNTGGGVAVADNDPSLVGTSPAESYRYTSSQNLKNFQRQVVNANNVVVQTSTPGLVVNGTGGLTFAQVDGGQMPAAPGDAQPLTPIAINANDGSHLVIGGSVTVYESLNRGDNLIPLLTTNGASLANANAMVYGGYSGVTPEENVLWVATNNGVYLRGANGVAGGPLTQTNYDAALYGRAISIAVNSTDWTQAYVIGVDALGDDHVWYTSNQGVTWTDLTANSSYKPQGLQKVVYVSAAGASGSVGAVLVGGLQGVYSAQTSQWTGVAQIGTTSWYQLGQGLPGAAVSDMQYDAKNDVLVVGTVGRGAWELTNTKTQIFGVPDLVSVVTSQATYQPTQSPTLSAAPTELTFDFNQNQVIDAKTLAGIQITRENSYGTLFPNAATGQFNSTTASGLEINVGVVNGVSNVPLLNVGNTLTLQGISSITQTTVTQVFQFVAPNGTASAGDVAIPFTPGQSLSNAEMKAICQAISSVPNFQVTASYSANPLVPGEPVGNLLQRR